MTIGARTITEVSDLIASREVSVTELVSARIRRIEELAPTLNCYITVLDEEDVLRRAAELDRQLDDGEKPGILHGVPVSVKDSLSTAGVLTTAGADLFADNVPQEDAEVVHRLKNAGAVLMAKDNMYDMAYGGPNPRFGAVRNPWNLDHSCGGSSSGSAAAVAAGLSTISLGTDAGGSIRMPSAFCGIVGLKPTYGLVPNRGEIPCQNTLSAIGPMTRTIRDAAVLLGVIASPPPGLGFDYLSGLEAGVRGLRIAFPREQETEVISAEAKAAFESVCETFEAEGAHVVPVDFPDFTLLRAVMWVVVAGEFTECLRPYLRTRPEALNSWTRAQLERAEYLPATEYVHAQRVRAKLTAVARDVLRDADALIVPSVAAPAFPLPKPEFVEIGGVREEPLNMSVRYTAAFNCLGYPALTLPCPVGPSGLPLGFQVVGKSFGEATVFRVARAYERVAGTSVCPTVIDPMAARDNASA
jgi:aspartyl-tRNA(Asn)/glutamyl-tRNA(Gln) amidotransferase subunit A